MVRGEPKVSSTPLWRDIEGFLIDRRARGLSPSSVRFYAEKLAKWGRYFSEQGIACVEEITPTTVRTRLLALGEGHTPGGVHAAYRALRAFLNWWDLEEPRGAWRNPLARVPAPRVPREVLQPVPLEDVRRMIGACGGETFTDVRDRALLAALLDTGCRAAEFVAIDVDDLDLATGEITVRRGKGAKPRAVFVGQRSRQAIAAYLAIRPPSNEGALWATAGGARLTRAGLREVLRRRARRAGVAECSPHMFRRAFALGCLRQGVDVFALQRLLGHSDLSVVRRYLAQTTDDLRRAHEMGGPVDALL